MTHQLRYAARTDRGLLRANNQDSVFAGDRLLIIADGMGGHAAGDVASRLVVSAFMPLDELPLGTEMRRPLVDATREGNAAIAEMVDENPEFDGMGTTLTALLFDGPQVALAHVGDSRAYLYRNGVLHQISHDDTFVQSLVDEGRITSDEAAHHPQRSLLLRALNGSEMDPSITLREISPGDRFLICSDGLSDYVSPESIADTLAGEDPDQVADTLIQLALVAGGPDNVTVIVADVVQTGKQPDPPGGLPGDLDPEATGPMQAIHVTQKFPRVPLPPIPEEPAAKPEFAVDEDEQDLRDGQNLRDGQDLDDEQDEKEAAERPRGDLPVSMVSGPPVRRWRRRSAFGLALVVLAAVALSGTYLWARSKYYVGADNGTVVVFRGVDGSLLGFRFASVQENSCGAAPGCSPMEVGDLQQDARDQVNAGITVGSLDEARGVLTRLSDKLLPICGQPVTGTTGTGAATGTDITTPSPSGALSSSGPSSAPTSAPLSTAGSGPTGPTGGPTRSAGTLASTVSIAPDGGPTAVTTTVVVTASPGSAAVTTDVGQRIRRAPVTTARSTAKPATTATGTPRQSPTHTAKTTAAQSSPAPTRTPTVTVFSTVTPSPSAPTSDTASVGVPLTSESQEPGVNCRSPR